GEAEAFICRIAPSEDDAALLYADLSRAAYCDLDRTRLTLSLSDCFGEIFTRCEVIEYDPRAPENLRPMLAANARLDRVEFPVLAQPKHDGIRCMIVPGLGPVTRSLHPIPNDHIRAALADAPEFADGELVTYTDGRPDPLNVVDSKVMSKDGAPEFMLHVFDHMAPEIASEPYQARMATLADHPAMRRVDTAEIASLAALEAFEARHVGEGWEGIILRAPAAPYKRGRSRVAEGGLLKVKRWRDDEATIVGVVEQMRAATAAERDALGYAKRSKSKSCKVPAGTLGALRVVWRGLEFGLSAGMSRAVRAAMWADRDAIIGRRVTFKFRNLGANGAPVGAAFRSLRSDI
ncbi:hypothetical protein, partial [Camelimonas lactis]